MSINPEPHLPNKSILKNSDSDERAYDGANTEQREETEENCNIHIIPIKMKEEYWKLTAIDND